MSTSKKARKQATTTDLFDIDQHLHKLAGSQNYMNQVSTITGDIFEVNMDYWSKKNTQICNSDDNILTLLKHIAKLQLKKGEVDEIDKEQRERNKEKYKEL